MAAPEILDALINAGLAVFPAMLDRGEGSVSCLGVQRATEIVEVTPSFTEGSPSETMRLTNRVKARRRAFAAVCETKQETWKDPAEVRAVRGLSLTLAVDGQLVGTRASPVFLDSGTWLVNLDAGWDALAVVCADGFRYAADLRHWFAAILKAGSSDEVAAILMEGGIPTYRLQEIALPDETSTDEADELAESPPTASVMNPGASDPGGQSQAAQYAADEDEQDEEEDSELLESQHFGASSGSADRRANSSSAGGGSGARRPPNAAPPNGTLRKRPLYDESKWGPSDRSRGSGRAAASAAAANAAARGMAAEAWFAERLQDTLPEGWHPRFNVRDDQVRESDVVLSSPELEWHIEIKCVTSERIFWSQLEQKKAEGLLDRYAMAFLVPEASGDYRVHWSWDPLKDLLACERRVDWVWSDTGQGPPLPPDSWEPLPGLKRPERPPSRMNFAIQLRDDLLRALPQDDSKLSG